jgi:hypothetical protein
MPSAAVIGGVLGGVAAIILVIVIVVVATGGGPGSGPVRMGDKVRLGLVDTTGASKTQFVGMTSTGLMGTDDTGSVFTVVSMDTTGNPSGTPVVTGNDSGFFLQEAQTQQYFVMGGGNATARSCTFTASSPGTQLYFNDGTFKPGSGVPVNYGSPTAFSSQGGASVCDEGFAIMANGDGTLGTTIDTKNQSKYMWTVFKAH